MYMQTRSIQHRSISRENIAEIVAFFDNLSKERKGRTSFHVFFADDSYILEQSSKFFSKPCFKHKDVSSISFNYTDSPGESSVKLILREEYFNSYNSSQYTVGGNDETWVHTTAANLDYIIDGLSKYSILRIAFTFPRILVCFLLFCMLSGCFMYMRGFQLGTRPLSADGLPDMTVQFIPLGAYHIVIFLLFVLIVAAVIYLYPEIEFAFGATRHLRRIRMRKVLSWLITAIIIPVFLSLLFGI